MAEVSSLAGHFRHHGRGFTTTMIIHTLGSTVVAVFAGGLFLVGVGFVHAAVKERSLTELPPAAFMLIAACNAAYHYTTPFSWLLASQVLLTGAFALFLRHLSQKTC
jgi:hypothetical protein